MKTRRVPVITKWLIALVVALALIPYPLMAQPPASPDQQLREAAKHGDLKLVQKLLEEGTDPNAKDLDGSTALMKAALGYSAEVITLLLAKGANINAEDCVGWTPLFWSVWGGRYPESVKVLLEGGANVNARTHRGRTPLMEASARDHQIWSWYDFLADILHGRFLTFGPLYPTGGQDPQIVKLLLQRGADVNAKDRDGWTALKRARKRGHAEIVNLLKAHGAKE